MRDKYNYIFSKFCLVTSLSIAGPIALGILNGLTVCLMSKTIPVDSLSYLRLTILIMSIFFLSFFIKKMWNKKEEALILLLVVAPQLKTFEIGVLDLLDLPIILLIISFLIDDMMFKEKRLAFRFPKHVLFLLLILVPYLSSINGGIRGITDGVKITRNVLYYLLLSVIMFSKKEYFEFAIKVLVITVGLSSIIAIIQEFLFLEWGIILVPGASSVHTELLLELTSFGVLLRSPAFCAHLPHQLASLLSFCIPSLFFLLISQQKIILKSKRLAFVSFFFMNIALLLTFSKSAWIGSVLGIILAILLYKPRYLLHFSLIAIAGLAFLITSGFLKDIFQALYAELKLGGDLSDRVFLIKYGLQRFLNHLWIGRGINLSFFYAPTVLKWPIHNGFVKALTEVGLIGFGIYILIIIFFVLKLLTTKNIFAKVLLSGLFGYLIQLQTEPFFFNPNFFLIIALIGALKSI